MEHSTFIADKTTEEVQELIIKTKGESQLKEYSREELIQRYKNIVKRWQNSDNLIRLFPEKYNEICLKLELLKSGAEFRVYDARIDVANMIMDLSDKICRGQQLDRFDNSKGLVGDHRKSDYKPKTDIGNFVETIIHSKMEGQRRQYSDRSQENY